MEKSFRRRFILLMVWQLIAIVLLAAAGTIYCATAWRFLNAVGIDAEPKAFLPFSWAKLQSMLIAVITSGLVLAAYMVYLFWQYRRLLPIFMLGQAAGISEYTAGANQGGGLRLRFIALSAVLSVALVMAVIVYLRFTDVWPYLYLDAGQVIDADAIWRAKDSHPLFRDWNMMITIIPFGAIAGNLSFVFRQYRMLRQRLQAGEPVSVSDYAPKGEVWKELLRNLRNYP